jgi:Na+-transporting NADH:ubiquinone oxidoreductase subunit NqrC
MPVPQRDWIDLVYAFAPAIAVFAAVIIGGVQLYIQWKQQQQDLFDKRYKIYEATHKYLLDLFSRNGWADSDDLRLFRANTSHTRFLFGRSVRDELGLIEKTTEALLHLQAIQSLHNATYPGFKGHLGDAEAGALKVERNGLTDALQAILDRQGDVFHRYLQLHHDRSWLGRLFNRINRWMDSDIPAKLATRNDA